MLKTVACPHCKGSGYVHGDSSLGSIAIGRPIRCPNCRGFRTYAADVTNSDLLSNLDDLRRLSVIIKVASESINDTLLRVSGVVLSDEQKKAIQDDMNKNIEKFVASKADIYNPVWGNLSTSDLRGFTITADDVIRAQELQK